MNKLVPSFTAIALSLSAAAFAQADAPAQPSAEPDASQGQEAQPKGFVLIQRNIYVPVDSEGKVASQNWVVIDKQGFITTEELEAAQREMASEEDAGANGKQGGDAANPKPEMPAATPSGSNSSLQRHPKIGEGPTVRS
jgi:hypothetical protein